jgi:DNA-directed RNA polymerase subunit alpha
MNRLLTDVRCAKTDINGTKGVFTYHPLTPGYGITLGNSLRRVLLSSIPSCGIYGIFIPGVSHQYAVINGIAEDVIRIIQNLKAVNFAFHSKIKDEHVIKIEFTGPGTVTSANIITDEVVDVLNKDVYICSVIDSIKFECNIYIKQGSGYLGFGTSEVDVDRKFADFIPINSIANAVKRVSFDINNVGYAGHTDYEELRVELETDGSLSPEEALRKAATVLMHGFAAIANSDMLLQHKAVSNTEHIDVIKPISKEDSRERVLSSSIRSIGIPIKICLTLEESGICFVGDLTIKTSDELMFIPKLGVRKVQEIEKRLHECGLAFRAS